MENRLITLINYPGMVLDRYSWKRIFCRRKLSDRKRRPSLVKQKVGDQTNQATCYVQRCFPRNMFTKKYLPNIYEMISATSQSKAICKLVHALHWVYSVTVVGMYVINWPIIVFIILSRETDKLVNTRYPLPLQSIRYPNLRQLVRTYRKHQDLFLCDVCGFQTRVYITDKCVCVSVCLEIR